jgi:hypothetical protein
MGSLRMPAMTKGETIHGWQWFPGNGCDGDGPAWVGSLGIKFGFWEKEISPGRTARVIVTGTMSKEPLFAYGDHRPALIPAFVWVGKIGGVLRVERRRPERAARNPRHGASGASGEFDDTASPQEPAHCAEGGGEIRHLKERQRRKPARAPDAPG